MSKDQEPLVTIPLSVYNELISKKYQDEVPFLIVGNRYTIKDYDNCTNTWLCDSMAVDTYNLVFSGHLGTRRMSITLKKIKTS